MRTGWIASSTKHRWGWERVGLNCIVVLNWSTPLLLNRRLRRCLQLGETNEKNIFLAWFQFSRQAHELLLGISKWQKNDKLTSPVVSIPFFFQVAIISDKKILLCYGSGKWGYKINCKTSFIIGFLVVHVPNFEFFTSRFLHFWLISLFLSI